MTQTTRTEGKTVPPFGGYRPSAGPDACMIVGEQYQFNFAQSPGGRGEFLGWTDFGWMVFRVYDRDADEYEARFYNPALLCTLRPESWMGA